MTHNWIKNRRWWSAIVRTVCGLAFFVLTGIGASQAFDNTHAIENLRTRSDLSASPATSLTASSQAPEIGTVDPVAPNLQTGYSRYITQCSTCHIPVPAAVLSQEAWYPLVTDTAHYGIALTPLTQFDQQLIWNYLRTYSRANWGNRIPAFRIADSVYFNALHPDITFEQPVSLGSCVTCHALADAGNFRLWQLPTDAGNEDTVPE